MTQFCMTLSKIPTYHTLRSLCIKCYKTIGEIVAKCVKINYTFQVLDPIQAEQIESRPMVQVYGRKKALSSAGAVLLNGVERLRASETMRMTRNMPDFHIDLLRLRQNWRLKKVSNTIVGDLSYRTAGSKFSQTGVFEVWTVVFILVSLQYEVDSFS